MSMIARFDSAAERTMPSDELARLCGVSHHRIVEDINRLIGKGKMQPARLRDNEAGSKPPLEVYDLNRRDSLVIAYSHCEDARVRVIDRWFEMERPADATVQTMSSREIAELVESRHDSVKRTIERLAERGLVSFTPSVETSHDGAGSRPVEVYRVGKRDSYVIVAQLSPEFTARLVDRWQELEEQVRRPVDPMQALNDPATMRTLLLSYSEKVLALESANAELSPKAHAFDRLAVADGSLNVTEAAKALQVRPKDLFAWLQAHGWIYRRAGGSGWLGYQHRVQQGVLEHKVGTVSRGDGSEKITEQVRITPKGLAKLAANLGLDAEILGVE